MAKIKILSAKAVNSLPEGFHADGGNLFLRVRDGSRVWFFRYKKAGKQISIGLGAAHSRSLLEARAISERMRNALLNGRNPSAEIIKKKTSIVTFDKYALEFIESKRSAWRNIKHINQWISTLQNYVSPKIGDKSPADISLSDVKNILSPIWTTKTETASRVRMRIEAVLDYAAVLEESDRRNPARWKGNLDKIFPAPRKVTKPVHFASAPYTEVPRIMEELRVKNSLSAYCLRFIILTAARSMEARSAYWSEINLEKRIWTIPASRMKANREHTVPLCGEAIEILLKMQEFRQVENPLVFQGERKGLISDVAINKTLRGVAKNCTTHGFRSSFRVWGAEMTVASSAVLELALAHANKNKIEAAYQRSNLFEKRRELMEAWVEFCGNKYNIMTFYKEKLHD